MGIGILHATLTEIDVVIAKALGVSEVAQIARLETLLRKFIHDKWKARAKRAVKAAVAATKAGKNASQVTSAVNKEMRRWGSDVSNRVGSEFERAYRLARIAGYKKATGQIKSSLTYDTKQFQALRKAKGEVLPSFTLVDQKAIKSLRKKILFWVFDNYDENVQDKIREVAEDVMIKHGRNRAVAGKVIGERLTKTLGTVRGANPAYFEALAANTVTTARVHGQLRSFIEADVDKYEINNPRDRRTCKVCNHMDGKVFSVEQGTSQMEKELESKTPEAFKAVHPWMHIKQVKTISSKPGAVGAKDAGALSKAGFSLPPFHYRCRCTIDLA
jgi:SPP1 gp7 family putative phage head morphogenesis protein